MDGPVSAGTLILEMSVLRSVEMESFSELTLVTTETQLQETAAMTSARLKLAGLAQEVTAPFHPYASRPVEMVRSWEMRPVMI